MRLRLTAVVAWSFLCVLVFVPSAQAAFPGENGKIAYTCQLPSFPWSAICVANPDGSGMATLAAGFQPVWSPDGTQIAFKALSAGGLGDDPIHLMNADGTGVTNVDDSPPSWAANYYAGSNAGTHPNLAARLTSPDGRLVAFWGETTEQPPCAPPMYLITCRTVTPLYVESTTGADRQQIGAWYRRWIQPADAWHGPVPADWSPDSKRLVVRAADGGCGEGGCSRDDSLQIIELATTSSTAPFRTISQLRTGRWVTWSPDGTKLLDNGVPTAQADNPFNRVVDVISVVNLDDMSETILPFRGREANWQPLPSHRNRAKACKAERETLGEQRFREKYGINGNGANAYGKCVSGN